MFYSWKKGGIALAACFLLTIIFVKPIGVSTQFVIFNGVIENLINPDLVSKSDSQKHGYTSENTYLNKSGGKYAKSIAEPINYGFVFVLSMILGGFLARKASSENHNALPTVYIEAYGDSPYLRYAFCFIGGLLALFGARLAGGCTSGHMMSGMMQTAVSGYFFTAAAFLAAVPTAFIIYGQHKDKRK